MTLVTKVIYIIFIELCTLQVQPTVVIYLIGSADWIHRLFEGAEDDESSLVIDDFRRFTPVVHNARIAKYKHLFDQANKKQWEEDYYYAPVSGYEPYWKGGDWVLLNFHDMRVQSGLSTYTTAEPRQAHIYCGRNCPDVFKERLVPVCAIQVGKNKYRTFRDMCEFLRVKCQLENKKDYRDFWRFNYSSLTWSFVQEGICPNESDIILKLKGFQVGKRVPVHMDFLASRFGALKFNFSPMPKGITRYFFRFPHK